MGRPVSGQAEGRLREVLDAAVEVFGARGYRATSMNDIAGAVGLGKPTLYHYVSSKAEILARLYEGVIDESIAAADEIVALDLEPLATLRELIVQRVAYTCEHRLLLRIFFEEEAALPAPLARSVVIRRRQYEDTFMRLVDAHLARRPVALASSVRVYVYTVLGAANWVYRWYEPSGSLSPRQLGEQMAELLLAPLREPAAPT